MDVRLSGHPLFEHCPTGVVLLTREGLVTEANGEARRTLALTPEQFVGRPVLATVVEADRERVKALFLRVLQGQVREWTARFRRGDGVTRVQWVRAVPLSVPDGAVRGVLMYLRDVTESRSGRPETVQLQTLLENLPGQFTALVDRSRRIRYSSGLTRTHYRDDVSVVGSPYADLLAPDDENRRLFHAMLDTVSAGDSWSGTHWHVRMDGTSFPVRTHASPYQDPRTGQLLGALVVGRDVSVERDARVRARSNQQMAGVGALTAAVSARLGERLDAMEDLVSASGRGGGSLDTFRDQVLGLRTYVRSLEALGAPVPAPSTRIDPVAVVREVLDDVAPRARSLGVAVRVEAAGDVPPVSAHPEPLARAVRMLVDNALEALADVDGPELAVRFSSEADRVGLHVVDNGRGLPADDVHRMFEPLFSTKPGGAGLGLPTARTIVQAWGGYLHADCADGRTTVTMGLLREAPGDAETFRPAPLTLARTRSVLIADDEPSVRSSLRTFLERVGFDVREAWSGRSALAQITVSTPPELILTDLRMDDGSGYWFLEELSRDFPELLRHTVIITGNAVDEQVTGLAHATGCPVLQKPLELPRLLEVLDDVSRRG
ncbi:MAG: PAS domain-containing protein [Longimicrobiales bacterium]